MPAGLPGTSHDDNFGNPQDGNFVIFDGLSGPKGTPFDMDTVDGEPQQCSTGGLSTGIGYGSPPIIGLTAPASILAAGFTDDYIPGLSLPDGEDSDDSTIMYIGGGRSEMVPPAGDDATDFSRAESVADPYTAGFAICGAGNGGSRDSGADTGFPIKTVTATGAVANGAAVEAGYVNRSGVALVTGQSVFGSAVAAQAAAS